jgi:hypothetical protein
MMDEAELRAFVRQAVKRHLEHSARPAAPRPPELPIGAHPSYGLLPVFNGRASDGACLIEPVVPCEHCRFFQSYGH